MISIYTTVNMYVMISNIHVVWWVTKNDRFLFMSVNVVPMLREMLNAFISNFVFQPCNIDELHGRDLLVPKHAK